MDPSCRTPNVTRVAALADLHCGRLGPEVLQGILERAAESADVIALGGDLTDFGQVEEARVLSRLLQRLKVPVVAVLGNHDVEGGQQEAIVAELRAVGVVVLDGDSFQVGHVGFAGVKGFCGGFGRHALGSWGEIAIKAFVQEAVAEALKLETALARLRTPVRLALLHYSPIEATVLGEPEQIFAFLGSSRLEEPINRYALSGVFHGHAHRGQPDGRTSSGVPVFNVSLPLMIQRHPETPFRVFEYADDQAS